jgi:hypothetical protein
MAMISNTTNIQNSTMAKLVKVDEMAPKPNRPKTRASIRKRIINPITKALLSFEAF